MPLTVQDPILRRWYTSMFLQALLAVATVCILHAAARDLVPIVIMDDVIEVAPTLLSTIQPSATMRQDLVGTAHR